MVLNRGRLLFVIIASAVVAALLLECPRGATPKMPLECRRRYALSRNEHDSLAVDHFTPEMRWPGGAWNCGTFRRIGLPTSPGPHN